MQCNHLENDNKMEVNCYFTFGNKHKLRETLILSNGTLIDLNIGLIQGNYNKYWSLDPTSSDSNEIGLWGV